MRRPLKVKAGPHQDGCVVVYFAKPDSSVWSPCLVAPSLARHDRYLRSLVAFMRWRVWGAA